MLTTSPRVALISSFIFAVIRLFSTRSANCFSPSVLGVCGELVLEFD